MFLTLKHLDSLLHDTDAKCSVKRSNYTYRLSVIYMTHYELQISERLLLLNLKLCFEYLC